MGRDAGLHSRGRYDHLRGQERGAQPDRDGPAARTPGWRLSVGKREGRIQDVNKSACEKFSPDTGGGGGV